MRTKVIWVCTMVLVVAGWVRVTGAVISDQMSRDVAEAKERFRSADTTLAPFFQTSLGYVIFPKVAKGGFVIGGARGEGLVYEKGKVVGKATLSQATVGAQIGGQVFREVVFFETQEALDRFKESKFEMSAQLGAVAAAEGVARNARYVEGVLVFTQAIKGLMAEASIGGQKFKFEPVANAGSVSESN